ncbi:hypothetical protein L6452_19991 [Arctium lappa]|uniref:Uncharacterized protein n=1 Tax=Arctium lappa TaxID=4217 RepID=A0ACB9BBE6_ARCLA|nr:hypothetical protein L6452_19991 [Arctium lappa]
MICDLVADPNYFDIQNKLEHELNSNPRTRSRTNITLIDPTIYNLRFSQRLFCKFDPQRPLITTFKEDENNQESKKLQPLCYYPYLSSSFFVYLLHK